MSSKVLLMLIHTVRTSIKGVVIKRLVRHVPIGNKQNINVDLYKVFLIEDVRFRHICRGATFKTLFSIGLIITI